jgi:hypothetical protein
MDGAYPIQISTISKLVGLHICVSSFNFELLVLRTAQNTPCGRPNLCVLAQWAVALFNRVQLISRSF